MAFEALTNDLLLAFCGDSLITRRLSTYREDEFLAVMELVKRADLAFTNLETTIHDRVGYPVAQSGGAWMVSPPYIVDELAAAGFVLLSRANNHALDWAVEGMLATSDLLDRAKLTHAGVGRNLAEARRPAYRDTPQGRVALVSASSTFPPSASAGHARCDVQGRPGLNPLRYATTCHVTRDIFASLEEMVRAFEGERAPPTDAAPRSLQLFGMQFVAADACYLKTAAYPPDLRGNLLAVAEARRQADWVVVSLHTHEADGENTRPAQFAVQFARECVAHGADVVIMHGAHVVRGVEVHQGKPILYGLGNFIFQTRGMEVLPEDVYERYRLGPEATPGVVFDAVDRLFAEADREHGEDESSQITGSSHAILAELRFHQRRLGGLKLHPLTLGAERSRPHSGFPRLARGERAKSIIEQVARLSVPFGATIEYERGMGLLKI